MERGIRMLKGRPWMMYVGSGVLFGGAFVHPFLWWLVLPATLLLLSAIGTASSWRDALWRVWVVGTLKAAGGIAWWWYVYPLAWLPVASGALQLIFIGVFWLATAASIGAGFAGALTMFWYAYKRDRRMLYGFPLLLVIAEVCGSIGFALFSYGPGSFGWLHFGFGYAGNALGQTELFLPAAWYAGVYGLSFLCAALALAAYLLMRPTEAWGARIGGGVLGAIGLALLFAHLVVSSREPIVIDAVGIDTNFPAAYQKGAEEYAMQRSEVVRAVEHALGYEPGLVLLPEDARLTRAFGSIDDTYAFVEATAGKDVVVVDSVRNTDERGEVVLRGFVYDTGGQRAYSMDKRYLVPVGEYLPHVVALPLRMLGGETPVAHMEENQNYRSGVHQAAVADQLDILFCFESAVPYGARSALRASEGRLLVHPISHAWFHEPLMLETQLRAMVRMQAVWNDVAILQAGNMADGALYRNDGTVGSGTILERTERWTLRRYDE